MLYLPRGEDPVSFLIFTIYGLGFSNQFSDDIPGIVL
jgi:hypothetical protein